MISKLEGAVAGQGVAIRMEPVDDVLERAQRGDLAAFEQLYRQHCSRIHGLCLRLTSDRARAEDLTQETFIRAWRKLPTLRELGGFAGWLSKVAVHLVYSEGRERQRRHRLHAALPADTGACQSTAVRLDLDQAIAELPDGARQVLVLHDVEGFRHREIAEQIGMSVGTSKSQLHRARKLLRERLA